MKIVILLSTYNGAQYLREQFDSLLRQNLSDRSSIEIFVRDDGSTDDTLDILEEYSECGVVSYYVGENIGVAESFWNLVGAAPDADYYAFCDQDDVWHDDKIARAIGALEAVKNRAMPLLYCSNVTVADCELNAQKNMIDGDVRTNFEHSLMRNIAPGCTFVFNSIAREYMRKYDMACDGKIIHDWLTFKIVSMLGEVVYDNVSTMLYRQHGNNVIGAKRKGRLKTLFLRIKRLMGKGRGERSRNARKLLELYGEYADDAAKHALEVVGNYKSKKCFKNELLRSDLYPVKSYKNLKWGVKFNII